MGLLIDVGIAKTNKYASRESGDTAEVVERPSGGISVVLADGQGSGRAAKTLSHLVCGRAVAMLKDGVRDEAAARGVQDALFASRHGQVSATLDILSVDLRSGTLVAARYSELPLLLTCDGAHTLVAGGGQPAGRYALAEPILGEWPLAPGLRAVVFSDGVADAGRRHRPTAIDLFGWADAVTGAAAQAAADALLGAAIALDGDKPSDDMCVVVVQIGEHELESNLVRRLSLQVPVP